MDAQQPLLQHNTTIKVSISGDTRRISAVLPTLAPRTESECQETYMAIRSVVAEGYSVAEASMPMLKYRDEDGDSCTLAACTVPDLLLLAKGRPLRLFADMDLGNPSAETQREMTCMESTAGACDHPEATPDAVAEHQPTDGAIDSQVAERIDQESKAEACVEDLTGADAAVVQATPEAAAEHQPADGATDSQGAENTDRESKAEACAEELTVSDAAAAQATSDATADHHSTEASTGSIDRLVDMGFPEDKARDALAACQGDEQQAVDSLLSGGEASANRSSSPELLSGLQSLLLQIRSRLTELTGQLRPLHEAVGRHWERRREHGQRAEDEGRKHLKQLQESIAELRVKLRELGHQWKGSAHCAAEKVKAQLGEMSDEAQNSFQKLDSQLEDAQQFLGDSLAALHGRASGVLQRVFNRASSSEATEEEQAVAAVDRAEAAEAVVAASESAALAAIHTVDEVLVGMGQPSEADDQPRMRAALSKGAGQAQEFLVRTFSRIQDKASEILRSSAAGSAGSNDGNTGESSSAAPIFRADGVGITSEAVDIAKTDVSPLDQVEAEIDSMEKEAELWKAEPAEAEKVDPAQTTPPLDTPEPAPAEAETEADTQWLPLPEEEAYVKPRVEVQAEADETAALHDSSADRQSE